MLIVCPSCEGSGIEGGTTCGPCSGSGKVEYKGVHGLAVGKIQDVMDKVNDIKEKVDEIKEEVHAIAVKVGA